MTMSGRVTPARGELLVDDELGDRRRRPGRTAPASAAPGSRRRPAPRALVVRRRGDLGQRRRGPRRGSARRGRRGRRSTSRRTPATARPASRAAAASRVAEQAAQRQRAAQVEVGVVLEGEADPAEHLDAGLGDLDRPVEARRCGDVGGEGPLLVVVPGGRATATSHAAAVTDSAVSSISAHRCLTAWKPPIGLPNCSRTFAYSTAVSRHQRASPRPRPRRASRPYAGPGRRSARHRATLDAARSTVGRPNRRLRSRPAPA